MQPRGDDNFKAACDRNDALGLQILAPLSSRYLPWSVSAMRPGGLVAVLNEIVVNRRRQLVELGGGVSTHYIGRLLRQRGGHLWTVEHDERWADLLEEELAEEALAGSVTIVRAPLTQIPNGWRDEVAVWYEQSRLRDGVPTHDIDLLVVDGPPAHQVGSEHSRYPALPFFAPMLAKDHAVILDDIDRVGEQEIVERWEREFGIAFERRRTKGGIAIGRSGQAFTI